MLQINEYYSFIKKKTPELTLPGQGLLCATKPDGILICLPGATAPHRSCRQKTIFVIRCSGLAGRIFFIG